ncbi:hypothetical protein [Paraburkholderia unamae]|uniref:Uncharacterized protein n=1 Tax=Paraburkholderia unamae TaxID=219649 RepID=A0ACC6RGU0_9BURK
MKILEKNFEHIGIPNDGRYTVETGGAPWKAFHVTYRGQKFWRWFTKKGQHIYAIFRLPTGGWYVGNAGSLSPEASNRVAGPFPCRKAAFVAWRMMEP